MSKQAAADCTACIAVLLVTMRSLELLAYTAQDIVKSSAITYLEDVVMLKA